MRARRALLPLTPCRAPPSATTTLVCRLSSCSTSSSTPSSSEPRFPPWSAVSHPSVLSPPFVFHARRSCRPCWPSPAAVCWSPCPSPSTVHGSCSLPRLEGGSVRRSRRPAAARGTDHRRRADVVDAAARDGARDGSRGGDGGRGTGDNVRHGRRSPPTVGTDVAHGLASPLSATERRRAWRQPRGGRRTGTGDGDDVRHGRCSPPTVVKAVAPRLTSPLSVRRSHAAAGVVAICIGTMLHL